MFLIQPEVVDLLLLILSVVIIFYVMRVKGVLRKDIGDKTQAKQKENFIKEMKRKDRMSRKLAFYKKFYNTMGMPAGSLDLERWEYRLLRLRGAIKSNKKIETVMGRTWDVEELLGKFKVFKYILVSCVAIIWAATRNNLFLSLLFGVMYPMVVGYLWDSKVKWLDDQLDNDFLDVYTLIHPRISSSTNTRLKVVLEEFTRVDNSLYGDDNESRFAVRYFVSDFIMALELKGSSTVAIKDLRKKYRSAQMVNFFSLAMQALSGVDNKEKLNSFKIHLENQRSIKAAEEERKKQEKANRVVYLIYFILFQFVLLSWASKFFGGGAAGALNLLK